MRLTWIIGNGFDMNLGLRTGYGDFRTRVYFSDSYKSKLKDRLIQKLGDAGLDDFETAELWSDLEELLGKVTAYYKADEADDFHGTFEEMEQLLTDYVHVQDSRLPDVLPNECVDEFGESITRFDDRMAPQDRQRFNLKDVADNNLHRFISLNYTQALARLIDASSDASGVVAQHRAGSSTYNDIVREPFYVHGAINEDGEGLDVVFGVDSPEQVADESLLQDPLFAENWVKASRNTDLYGNANERELQKLIANTDVFCVYGCSMGKTDGRIWRAIGEHLVRHTDSKLVLFVYGLPDRHGREHRNYQRVREGARRAFQLAASLKDEAMASLDGRIFFVSSQDFFKMDGKLELGADPYDAGDLQD